MKIPSKTPYEIRLELLQLSASILMTQHRARAQSGSSTFIEPTTYPTTEDIVAEAEKMNHFVSKSL